MARWAEGRNVLVTGASGLVGHAVVQRFVADGASVVAADSRATDLPCPTVALDLTKDAWPEGPWHTIVHCAAHLPERFEGAEADAATADNRAMDDRALDASAASGAHLVYLSTASVYGTTVGDIDDETPAAPLLHYAREKLATEQAIAARSLPASVFRLVAPYGPRQKRMTVLLRFIDLALRGEPLRYYGTGARTQDFLHVDDIADAIAIAARDRVSARFLLASGVATTMRDLAKLVVDVTKSTSTVEAAGIADPEEERLIRYRIDRLHELLEFTPSRSLADGIAQCAVARRAVLAGGAS